jgi:hypothetical protein
MTFSDELRKMQGNPKFEAAAKRMAEEMNASLLAATPVNAKGCSPKLQAEYERLYPNVVPLRDDYKPYNEPPFEWKQDHTGRATFWRWYIGSIALVIVGCTLWAYYA